MFLQPLPQPAAEKWILEVLTPECAESHAALVQAAIQVQHAYQPRPLPGPVSDRKNRSAMMLEAGEHVVAVLPYRFRNNNRGFGMDLRENIHAHPLVIDEAVLQVLAVRMRAPEREPLRAQGFRQLLFHLGLRRPANLISGL